MFSHFGFLDLGTPELVLILLIVLLLFGGKKLPEVSHSIGASLHELRKGMNDGGSESKNEKNTTKSSANAKQEPNS